MAMTDPQNPSTGDLFETLRRIEQRARSKSTGAVTPVQDTPLPAAKPAKVLQLWNEDKRGVPNGILRSALFGAICRGRRRALEGEILAAVDGVTIRYTGWRLDQTDLDVWEQAVHLARSVPLGEPVPFSAHSFLKAIGRCTGKSQHQQLATSFRRLTASAVEITIGRYTYMGPLIHDCYRDEKTGQYLLTLNPKLLALWAAGWTAIDWRARQALQGQPLALWVHGFYSSHADAYPYSVEKLRQLCGSETKQLFHFRAELREALTKVQAVDGIKGWEIVAGDLVKVEGKPSDAQRKHLKMKARKTREGQCRRKLK